MFVLINNQDLQHIIKISILYQSISACVYYKRGEARGFVCGSGSKPEIKNSPRDIYSVGTELHERMLSITSWRGTRVMTNATLNLSSFSRRLENCSISVTAIQNRCYIYIYIYILHICGTRYTITDIRKTFSQLIRLKPLHHRQRNLVEGKDAHYTCNLCAKP